jgi:hypothetical protein
LGLDGDVPDHSTFPKNRHGRFRASDLLRKLFETVVARCMTEGIVEGEPKCCPNMLARKIARSVHEAARDRARAIAKTEAYAVSCRERKKIEMLFAHLKRILRLGRLRLRGPNGAKDEFLLAATAQKIVRQVRVSDSSAFPVRPRAKGDIAWR